MSEATPYVSAPSEAVLQLKNVSKFYGASPGVEDVSFDLHRGEILTLLGPSGCGKTTTLRIAVGLERASKGQVWLDGHLADSPTDKTFVPPNRRGIGMVFQSYAIWPHMSVFQNVAYPLKIRRRKAAEIRDAVVKALDLVGLESFRDRPGTKLSGGQQQRVAVARGLVFGPDLLLMDEPFSNLDAKLREQMRVEVKLLQRRLGIAVLFVTHDQIEALALSDRIAVMCAGHMEQIGSPSDLYVAPRSAIVRDFLGRVVLFNGAVTSCEGDEVCASLLEGGVVYATGLNHMDNRSVAVPCVAAIRPEHIAVEPEIVAGADTQANVLRAQIAALLFLGDRFEATVRLPSGRTITLFLRADGGWQEGQQVSLRLPPHRIQLWPADGEAAR